ncbi:sulfite exporter TauE/SafE family protein [soil metagenome]
MSVLFITAFTIGIMGGVHCIGMCGPLALSLPLNSSSAVTKALSVTLYNFGRITTYAFMGAVFGIIGQTVSLFGYQQLLSVLSGIGILFFLFIPKKIFDVKIASQKSTRFFIKVRSTFAKLMNNSSNSSMFGLGLLNGLLPCGLVYMAIAGAVATGAVLSSSLFMASFGLGTLPLMWVVAFAGKSMSINMRQHLRKLSPVIMSIMAILLIVRGLDMDIPFLSPHLQISAGKINSCCTKP